MLKRIKKWLWNTFCIKYEIRTKVLSAMEGMLDYNVMTSKKVQIIKKIDGRPDFEKLYGLTE